MKSKIAGLKKGDVIRAQVVEMVNAHDCILSFHGDLLRVKNESPLTLQAGASVLVRVSSEHPLVFQLATGGSPRRMDRHI